MRRSRLLRLHCIAAFCCLAALSLAREEPAEHSAEPGPVAVRKVETVKLGAADRESLRKLFERFSQAVLSNNADECLKLFAPLAAERNRLVENIREEFAQSRYTRFEIIELRTDDAEQDMERRHVYTVDVVLRIEAGPRGSTASPGERQPYSTTYPIVVQRFNDGSFGLRYSELFKTWGLRRGPRLTLFVGAIAAFCAVLMFWVWMGWEAWRERPRARVWRSVVIVPVAGSLVYFLFRLLPRWLKKD